VADHIPIIEELLQEELQTSVTDERRSVPRTPFVRPVIVVDGRRESHDGCSVDISKNGISLITKSEWKPNSVATLNIHSLRKRDETVKAEVRWCRPFGEGWHISGWRFLS
jgi:hypothetical protein